MKVPPKRKGNSGLLEPLATERIPLNESPSEKEGKSASSAAGSASSSVAPSMKVPPKRKGNHDVATGCSQRCDPSMKVPPKRKGNPVGTSCTFTMRETLNESPSEKEGKSLAASSRSSLVIAPQ